MPEPQSPVQPEWLLHPVLTLLFGPDAAADGQSVSVRTLQQAGLTDSQFGWLLWCGLATLTEVPAEAADRSPNEAYVAPTGAGRELFARLRGVVATMSVARPEPKAETSDRGEGATTARPFWDAARRELWLNGRCVKRLVRPARNQELILAVFQEENWPPRNHDPLPPQDGIHSRTRFRDTIAGLNQGQDPLAIRFLGDGTGEGVRWEFVG